MPAGCKQPSRNSRPLFRHGDGNGDRLIASQLMEMSSLRQSFFDSIMRSLQSSAASPCRIVFYPGVFWPTGRTSEARIFYHMAGPAYWAINRDPRSRTHARAPALSLGAALWIFLIYGIFALSLCGGQTSLERDQTAPGLSPSSAPSLFILRPDVFELSLPHYAARIFSLCTFLVGACSILSSLLHFLPHHVFRVQAAALSHPYWSYGRRRYHHTGRDRANHERSRLCVLTRCSPLLPALRSFSGPPQPVDSLPPGARVWRFVIHRQKSSTTLNTGASFSPSECTQPAR